MKRLESLDQLKIGTRLMIVAKSERDCYGSVSVKKIIEMRKFDKKTQEWSEPYDYEILINKRKKLLL